MRIRKLVIFCIISAGVLYFYIPVLSGDTIVMKDNERLKGVVVEEYKDRIVLSTMEGEKEILMNNVKNVIFDLEEQNLTNLADYYLDRGMYGKAYYYYNKALEINPEYKKAKSGLNYVGTYMQQTNRMKKLSHIQLLQEEKRWKKGIPETDIQSEEAQVKDRLGIVLKNVKETYEISEVVPGSPADAAGIKRGDILLVIWGRAVSYMQPKEVMKRLLSPGVMDVQVTVKRAFMLDLKSAMGNYSSQIDAKLGFSEMEGLMVEKVVKGGVADTAGVEDGDIVVEIQGESTRYMPLDDIEHIINSRRGDTLSLHVKRDMVIWKKFKEKKMGG